MFKLGVVACGDEIFDSTICDSTSSIFIGSNNSTEDAYGLLIMILHHNNCDQISNSFFQDSTSSAFRSTPEELEVMAKNAPSIGDEIEFKDFNFDDCILVGESAI